MRLSRIRRFAVSASVHENAGMSEQAEPEAPGAEIDVRPNGPLQAKGPTRIVGADGAVLRDVAAGESAWLCRCGQSQRKPFCDGTHNRVGFEDPGLGSAPATAGD